MTKNKHEISEIEIPTIQYEFPKLFGHLFPPSRPPGTPHPCPHSPPRPLFQVPLLITVPQPRLLLLPHPADATALLPLGAHRPQHTPKEEKEDWEVELNLQRWRLQILVWPPKEAEEEEEGKDWEVELNHQQWHLVLAQELCQKQCKLGKWMMWKMIMMMMRMLMSFSGMFQGD